MKHNILLFDLLRGVASVAVVLCHCAILGGGILFGGIGERAVDVFMFASGFLMVFTATKSREYEGLETRPGVMVFWTRRFFRISPLYYLILILAVMLGPALGACRDQIATVLPHTATAPERYYFTSIPQTLLWHVSYLYGLFPSKAFTTPLPDWSLSLEMQFYAVFPVVLYLLRKRPALFIGLCVAMVAVAWQLEHAEIRFRTPSFLPLKFHIFATGMLTGAGLLSASDTIARRWYLLALAVVAVGERSVALTVFVLLCQAVLLSSGPNRGVLAQKFAAPITWLCRLKLVSFFAEISYSLYLVHLLVALPLFGYVFTHPALPSPKNSPVTWAGYTLVVLGISTAISYATYRFVELPGIAFGKRLGPARPVIATAAR